MSLEYACIFSVGLLHLQQTGRKITVLRETSFIRGRPESGSAFIISYERGWGTSAGDRPAPEPEQVRASLIDGVPIVARTQYGGKWDGTGRQGA